MNKKYFSVLLCWALDYMVLHSNGFFKKKRIVQEMYLGRCYGDIIDVASIIL